MSTEPSTATAKICGICGEDCAGQPRIKDPKGRYYHKACYERVMAERAAAASAPADRGLVEFDLDPVGDDGPSFLDDFAAPAAAVEPPPGMVAGAGAVKKARSGPSARDLMSSGLLAHPGVWFAIAFLCVATPAAFVFANAVVAFTAFTVMASVIGIAWWVLVFIDSAREGYLVHSIGSFLTAFFPIWMLYMILAKIEDQRLRASWAGMFVGGVVFYGVLIAAGAGGLMGMMEEGDFRDSGIIFDDGYDPANTPMFAEDPPFKATPRRGAPFNPGG